MMTKEGYDDRVETLISAERIHERVAEMGAEISDDYRELDPIVVCILKGSLPFFADLGRQLSVPVRYDALAVSSYDGAAMSSSGVVKFTHDLSMDITGQHVLLVEDIVDTGLTITYLRNALGARRPASLKVATLLDKPSRRQVYTPVDYRGFVIPDAFVVGYGLDFDQYYRNLPYVGILHDAPLSEKDSTETS